MKYIYRSGLTSAIVAAAALFSAAVSHAQVEVVVPAQPAPGTSVVVEPITPLPAPGEHVVEIEVAVSGGTVQAYFGRAPARERVEIGDAEISFKLPSTATVTKLASRDKDAVGSPKRITPDNPWAVRVVFSGPGRYVFNIVEWDDDPTAVVALRLDGAVIFSGRGSEEDFDDWSQKSYGPGVRKTGSREIAFMVP